jgi:broad specificity phosphatase PhoE
MTQLYLVRHGDYLREDSSGKLISGDLSPLGTQQAQSLRDSLTTNQDLAIDVLIASTMPRAQQTAHILAPALHLPVISDAAFEEWHNEDGSLTREQFFSMWNSVSQDRRLFYHWIPGYENWVEFSARVCTAFDRILHEYEGKNIMLVCHGGVIEMSFVYFFGMSFAQLQRATTNARHTSITHWRGLEDRDLWILERYNDTSHLTG